jgi:hypothetical protein
MRALVHKLAVLLACAAMLSGSFFGTVLWRRHLSHRNVANAAQSTPCVVRVEIDPALSQWASAAARSASMPEIRVLERSDGRLRLLNHYDEIGDDALGWWWDLLLTVERNADGALTGQAEETRGSTCLGSDERRLSGHIVLSEDWRSAQGDVFCRVQISGSLERTDPFDVVFRIPR